LGRLSNRCTTKSGMKDDTNTIDSSAKTGLQFDLDSRYDVLYDQSNVRDLGKAFVLETRPKIL
jgi:hypothetical protein